MRYLILLAILLTIPAAFFVPYFRRCWLAFDVFCNVVVFFGLEDETISSHAARIAQQYAGKRSFDPRVILWIWLNNLLLFIAHKHGIHAEAGDLGRAETVVAIEKQALDSGKK